MTGYGVIDLLGSRSRYVDSGCIRLKGHEMPQRLRMIFEAITEIIFNHKPQEMAIEQVFMARNPDSALKLGQARGVAMCAGVMSDLPVSEYAARSVKQAVVGTGAADKVQVQHMVCALLELESRPQADAADALAVAICHGHRLQMTSRFGAAAAQLAGRRR